MSFHSRGPLTAGPSKKRKEPLALYDLKPPSPKAGEPLSSIRLLAGYMAHEFLNRGTILGRKFDPDRAEATAVVRSAAQSKKPKTEAEPTVKEEPQSYSDVASILKTDGAHISGIVNPTQLARWLQK